MPQCIGGRPGCLGEQEPKAPTSRQRSRPEKDQARRMPCFIQRFPKEGIIYES